MKGVLFVLKQHHYDLAATEAKAAMCGWNFWKDPTTAESGAIFFPGKRKIPQNLGLVHRIIKIYASCSVEQVRNKLETVNLPIHGSYRVSLTRLYPHKVAEKELANILWGTLTRPRVQLKHPENTVEIVLTKKRAYIGLLAWTDTDKWESRKAHSWPAPHPSATHPTTARALVTLACSQRIHDPFCGAGGFLIEAGLVDIHASGSDISREMVVRARTNLKKYRLPAELRIADATTWLPNCSLICDLPYGKSTRPVDRNSLIEAFLLRARQSTKRVIMGVPCPLESTHGWTVRVHLPVYVHKQLSRHFYVLEAV